MVESLERQNRLSVNDRVVDAPSPTEAGAVVSTGHDAVPAVAAPDSETGRAHPSKGVVDAVPGSHQGPAGVHPGSAGISGRRWWGGERAAARPAGDRRSPDAEEAAPQGTLDRWTRDLLADLREGGGDPPQP
jgi:hypothetical protein